MYTNESANIRGSVDTSIAMSGRNKGDCFSKIEKYNFKILNKYF